MNAIERREGQLPKTAGPARPAASARPSRAPLPVRTQRALWHLLRSRTVPTRFALEELDRDRLAVSGDASPVNLFLVDRFTGERCEAEVLAQLNLVGVLELTALSDAAGAREAAGQFISEIDRFLKVYDWVDDKSRLFEALSPAQAATVTRLFRLRRNLGALADRLDDCGATLCRSL